MAKKEKPKYTTWVSIVITVIMVIWGASAQIQKVSSKTEVNADNIVKVDNKIEKYQNWNLKFLKEIRDDVKAIRKGRIR